jgi:Mg2+ and Co2+ transporter CorA
MLSRDSANVAMRSGRSLLEVRSDCISAIFKVRDPLSLTFMLDHIVTMVQNLNHYEKILSRSHSNYLAQISIEMAKANNDTNDTLSRLTVLGTILIPMNLVTGLWVICIDVQV